MRGYVQQKPLLQHTVSNGPCLNLLWKANASGFGFSPGPLMNPTNDNETRGALLMSYTATRPLYLSSPPLKDNASRSPEASQAIFSMPWQPVKEAISGNSTGSRCASSEGGLDAKWIEPNVTDSENASSIIRPSRSQVAPYLVEMEWNDVNVYTVYE